MKLLLLLLSFNALAGFQDVNEENLYNYKEDTKTEAPKKKTIHKKRGNNILSEIADQIMAKDVKLMELLEKSERRVIVRKKALKVTALTRVKGTVLNSILAMNVKPSRFIVKLSDENELLDGGEIRCTGYSFQKRVPANCDLLVLDDVEYGIDVNIWDLDGAEGVIADYFYSGEEKAFLTSSFASFLQGVLDVAKDRVATPFGDVSRNNGKNKVMSGLMGVASNVKEKIAESGEKNLTIAYVNSGKEVLVFFNKGLNMEVKR